MISNTWLERRKQYWDRLEGLLAQSGKNGIASLSRSELREMGLLYRQTAADLSALREDPSGTQFARYLNQLLGRAHNTIYAARKSSPAGILRFYLRDYPAIFRRMLPYPMLALLVFSASAVVGVVVTVIYPDFMRDVLGPGMVRTIERQEMWTHSIVSMKPQASSAIMTNNLGVSFLAFAMGITGGLGTLFLMVTNGILFGVINAACWMAGMSSQLWGFVAPHGVLELPAIFLAGGAGLRIGHALLFPGLHSRRDSLSLGGGEAVQLLLGAIPMLVIAGVVEGFFSPLTLPLSLKLAVAGALFVLLVLYLGSGRAGGEKRHTKGTKGFTKDTKRTWGDRSWGEGEM